MPVDPTVVATPFYFASMEVERRWLRRRAARIGPSPADYTRPDTTASLTMGVASLVVPVATAALIRHVTPGRGRFGRHLVATAVAAAAATTVADAVVRHEDTTSPAARPRRRRRWAERVARIGGPVAIATGTVALGSAVAHRASPARMWRRGSRHDLGTGPLAWLVAVGGWDFIYYWNHRFMHEVRLLWAHHVVHHSSERYNLSTALRQPVADVLGVYLPYGVLSRVGVRPTLVQQARAINLLYQYWIHTDATRRVGTTPATLSRAQGDPQWSAAAPRRTLPTVELLNLPSHHRVHHGTNRRYLDRNHGSILIVWDRLFGTFQREEEPVVYGLTRNIETHNPLRIASHEFADIVRDLARSTTWRDRLAYSFRGPGWAYARRAVDAPSAENPTAPRSLPR